MMGDGRYLTTEPASPSAAGSVEREWDYLHGEEFWKLSFLCAMLSLLPIALDHWLLQPFQATGLGLLLMATALMAYGLSRLSPRLGIGGLTAGIALAAWLLVRWWPGAYALLAAPALMATFTMNTAGSLAVTAATLAMIAWSPAALSGQREATLLLVGLAWTLGWLERAPRQAILSHLFGYYRQACDLLQEARDQHLALKQANLDLADAYRQLARLHELLRASQAQAESARRAKEEFVAKVSHELRTPLNMIIGFSEMIVDAPHAYGSRLPPALLADLAVIQRNSQHLSSLIDDVLDLSQIEAGRMALTRERVAIAEILAAATEAVRPLFASKGLSLCLEIAPDLPLVLCDRTRVREVALNLLSNAGRFTEKGGVTVRARRVGHDVQIDVIDTGPGVSDADRERLFQPFEQLDGSIRRRYGGSGLGLAISRGFVELHGGKMWLESTPGVGTTVSFTLPIDPPAPVVSSPVRWLDPQWEHRQRTRRSLAPAPSVRPRVIVVESGDVLRRLLNRYLDGVEIIAAASLEEAQRVQQEVLAQAWILNDATAGATSPTWGSLSDLPSELPVIRCVVPGIEEAAGALGVAGYLVKPISQQKLLAALDQLPHSVKTVLIVDDEPDAQRLFWRILATAGRGYRVLTAADGVQALQIMAEQRPDAILLDLMMPALDGFAVLAAKNADDALRAIPTIIISARDPAGQPIVSQGVSIARRQGLALPELLACIEAAITILTPRQAPTASNGPASPAERRA